MNVRRKHGKLGWVLHLGGLSPWELTKRVFKDSRRDDALGRAAQLSFYLLLAFFPLVIFACSVAGSVVSDQQRFSDSIMKSLRPLVPDAGYSVLQSILHQVLGSKRLRVGSLLFALWTASYGLEAIITGVNVAFDIRESRSWWKRRLLAIAMTAILAAAIIVLLLLAVWGQGTGAWLADREGIGWLFRAGSPYLGWTLIVVALFCAVTLIYRFAPNLQRESLFSVLPGAVVAIALWIGSSLAFRYYVDAFFSSYKNIYGSLGAVIAIMLWLYLSSTALIVGAELNSEIRWAASDAGDPHAKELLQENRKR